MGCSCIGSGSGSGSCNEYNESDKNPNPRLFTIVSKKKVGSCHLLWVHYIGCTNYEGHKILVFEGEYHIDWDKTEHLDPHFTEEPGYLNGAKLIARFIPTKEGWEMAQSFAKLYLKGKQL